MPMEAVGQKSVSWEIGKFTPMTGDIFRHVFHGCSIEAKVALGKVCRAGRAFVSGNLWARDVVNVQSLIGNLRELMNEGKLERFYMVQKVVMRVIGELNLAEEQKAVLRGQVYEVYDGVLRQLYGESSFTDVMSEVVRGEYSENKMSAVACGAYFRNIESAFEVRVIFEEMMKLLRLAAEVGKKPVVPLNCLCHLTHNKHITDRQIGVLLGYLDQRYFYPTRLNFGLVVDEELIGLFDQSIILLLTSKYISKVQYEGFVATIALFSSDIIRSAHMTGLLEGALKEIENPERKKLVEKSTGMVRMRFEYDIEAMLEERMAALPERAFGEKVRALFCTWEGWIVLGVVAALVGTLIFGIVIWFRGL